MIEEPKKQKKGSLWPWLVALAGGGILYYFGKKRKVALARAKEAQLQTRTQPTGEKAKPGDNHPGLRIRGQGGQISPNNRLRAIMEEK